MDLHPITQSFPVNNLSLYGRYWNRRLTQRTIIYQSYWSAPKRSSKSLFKSSVFCLYRTQARSCFILQHLPHAKHSFCVPLNWVNKQKHILGIFDNKEEFY